MRLLIMGAPGAGKGTQAVFIKDYYKIPHISTGDMFREAIANKTPIGVIAKSYIDQGHLVPDDVTNALVKERLQHEDCANGFILDGYPRNLSQANALDVTLSELGIKLDAVVNIDVDTSILVDRIVGRWVCKKCGASYHVKNAPSKVEGICDICGEPLVHRADDNPETVGERLNVYFEQTHPLLDFYSEKGIVKNINGCREIKVIFDDIVRELK